MLTITLLLIEWHTETPEMAKVYFSNYLRNNLKQVATEVIKAEGRLSSTALAIICEDVKESQFCK